MDRLALHPDVGAVGSLLRYPNGRIQYMGIEIKLPWATRLIGYDLDLYAHALTLFEQPWHVTRQGCGGPSALPCTPGRTYFRPGT